MSTWAQFVKAQSFTLSKVELLPLSIRTAAPLASKNWQWETALQSCFLRRYGAPAA
jgi:hypothetical protein